MVQLTEVEDEHFQNQKLDYDEEDFTDTGTFPPRLRCFSFAQDSH